MAAGYWQFGSVASLDRRPEAALWGSVKAHGFLLGPSRRPWPLAGGSGYWGSSAATVAPGPQVGKLMPRISRGGNYRKGVPVAIPRNPQGIQDSIALLVAAAAGGSMAPHRRAPHEPGGRRLTKKGPAERDRPRWA
jgi:hypothetical protein